jgi:hypothetical protein
MELSLEHLSSSELIVPEEEQAKECHLILLLGLLPVLLKLQTEQLQLELG